MKTALRALAVSSALFVSVALSFYLGFQFMLAAALREGVDVGTIQRVEFLRSVRSDLPNNARVFLERELADMAFSLDSALQRRGSLFLDRSATKEALDSALVYFAAYRPATANIMQQFSAASASDSPLREGFQSWDRQASAVDRRLAELLREFDPAKLNSSNRRLHDKITTEASNQ